MDSLNNIAWLIPSRGDALALQAIQMRQNKPMALEQFNHSSLPSSGSKPGPALQLSFDHLPKSHTGFVLGTDESCDVVLPKMPGISRRHCHLTFDSESRLVLRDTSRHGTAVWYDHHSNGDKRNFTWVLSSGGSYGFPDLVKRIVIDIQTVRFQIIVNEPADDVDGYADRVTNFLDCVAARRHEPVFDNNTELTRQEPHRARPVYLKYTMQSGFESAEQTFVWNTARPWEPIVRLAD